MRARVRSLFFEGLEALIFEIWKPSIPEALGGRRGSRSDMNTTYYHAAIMLRSCNGHPVYSAAIGSLDWIFYPCVAALSHSLNSGGVVPNKDTIHIEKAYQILTCGNLSADPLGQKALKYNDQYLGLSSEGINCTYGWQAVGKGRVGGWQDGTR